MHRGLNSGIWSPEVDASWVRRIHVACGWVMECSWVRVTQSCHFEHKLLYFFAAKIWCSLKVYWNGKRLSTLNIVLQEAVFRDVLFSSILLFTRFLFYLCVRAFCLAVCSSTPRGLHCDCWAGFVPAPPLLASSHWGIGTSQESCRMVLAVTITVSRGCVGFLEDCSPSCLFDFWSVTEHQSRLPSETCSSWQ